MAPINVDYTGIVCLKRCQCNNDDQADWQHASMMILRIYIGLLQVALSNDMDSMIVLLYYDIQYDFDKLPQPSVHSHLVCDTIFGFKNFYM